MSKLPAGTVTFLFTDIEGSTALLKRLGQNSYDEVLVEHNELLRATIAAHDGLVVDTQGDSFFAAFQTAGDAVAAAADAQRELAAHEWGGGVGVKVRMGLHTGEPKVGDERYVGIGVHRAARIGAAGHGGQVLLSSTTKELAEEDLPAGVTIRDLGERRLKDLDQPQRLYQLVVDGLETEFAQLKTLDVELARKRRRMYAGAALIGVLAAAVAIPVFAFGQARSGGGVQVKGNAVAIIDPGSNDVTGQVPVGARPQAIAAGSDALWVANLDDQSVSRVDPASERVMRTLAVGNTPTGIATSKDAVWIVGSVAGKPFVTVSKLDPRFNSVSERTSVGTVGPGDRGAVAANGQRVWVAPLSGLLTRLNPHTARRAQQVDPNAGPTGVAVGPDAVWVTDSFAGTVTRVDPTGLVTPIGVGHSPTGIAAGAGAVWVADTADDAVVRIDPTTRSATSTINVGAGPVALAVGGGSIWVANSGDGTVTRIDAATATPTRTIHVGGSPQGVAIADGKVWVTVQNAVPRLPAKNAAGETLRVTLKDDVDYMDPALAYYPQSWQLLNATCAKLLDYPDKPAPAGSQLVPEVARSLPQRSRDGKTYTFDIRPGYRFSPPSNEPVTAETFKYTIERSLSPAMKGPGREMGYLGQIVGARAYMAGKVRHISGLVAKGNTLTMRLVAPTPELPALVTIPFFCAVPVGTPIDAKGLRDIPSAGPYYVSAYEPGQGIVLKRNPNYHGPRPHRPNRIEVSVGVSDAKAVREIESGAADLAAEGVGAPAAPRLAARYGKGSEAARNGHQRYFTNPMPGLDFLVLNTHRGPFRDARLRRAVNYAIDRRALARLGVTTGSLPETPTDMYLPPATPGYTDAHVFSLRPDLVKARKLAGRKQRRVVLYTCSQPTCDEGAQIIRRNLAAIGIDVVVKAFSLETLFNRMQRPGEPFDMAVNGWVADYLDPSVFLNVLLEGPSEPSFDDPQYKRKLAEAARLSGPARYLAYSRLDAELVRNGAPWVAIGNPLNTVFFSARTGCQVFQPAYGSMDLTTLCIRK